MDGIDADSFVSVLAAGGVRAPLAADNGLMKWVISGA
jgi:hypothetical protein